MAVALRSPEVSDLCIGKPPVRSLPPSATVADALAALRSGGAASYVAVVAGDRAPSPSPSPEKARDVAGRVGIADVVCFLCGDERSLADPGGALRSPVSALLPKDAPPIRRVEPHASVLEALDVILEGASALVVPIRSGGRRRLSGGGEFCWLTHEDFVRYFLNSIALFAPVAALSVAALGLVRPAGPSVRLHDPALSALPLLRRALADHSAVAVLSAAGDLAGELSPALLASSSDVTAAAAAVATLSVGDLMAFADYASPPESLVRAIKSRLKGRGLDRLLDLIEEDVADAASVLSVSPFATSSSSDEESVGPKRRRRQRSGRSLSSSEAAACHPGSSLMAVMVQAVAHRVSHVWVVEDDVDDYGSGGRRLVGIVAFADVLSVFREQLVEL
ncbi:CBS domain-containing protein CBSX5 [Ananas comosus]|uniref:CBS domain-containing protein CBSX5 n=1 Tax=Ananas comosus TaxID=4615 RepID=A0A199V7D2_ANACO|nr:CBS domain-containing protein CBSX5 [Ananas comosus]